MSRDRKNICAIVLAAGSSSRFGRNKLLIELNSKPIIALVVERLLDLDLSKIVVVTGHYHREVVDALKGYGSSLEIVYNENYIEGLSTSIKAGISACGDVDGYLFMLGDQPLVCGSTIGKLIDVFVSSGKAIVIPMYRGNRGNPVLVSSRLKKDLLDISGDVGARAIFDRYLGEIVYVETMDPGVVVDVDTPEDLDRVRRLLDNKYIRC